VREVKDGMGIDSRPCPLCDALADASRTEGPLRRENTALLITPGFVLLPSVGPLVKGHSLLVTKDHHLNLAALPTSLQDEYDALAVDARMHLRRNGLRLIEVEHGSTAADSAGACIVHTHIHWFPANLDIEPIFNRSLETLADLPEISGLHRWASHPYILTRSGLNGRVRLYNAENAPSQLARRLIAELLGIEMWDWGAAPRDKLIIETIDFWKQLDR
jgi:hypothetical protein